MPGNVVFEAQAKVHKMILLKKTLTNNKSQLSCLYVSLLNLNLKLNHSSESTFVDNNI